MRSFFRNLPRNKKGRAPNPVVTLQVSGESAQCSGAVMCSHNPVFEEEFVFRVTSALSDNLTLKVLYPLKLMRALSVIKHFSFSPRCMIRRHVITWVS